MKPLRRATLLSTTFLLFFCTTPGRAQDYMPLRFEGFASAGVNDPQSAFAENLDVRTSKLSVGAAYPAPLGRGRLIAGLRYDLLSLTYDNWTIALSNPDALHYLRAELFLIQPLSERWWITVLAAPGIASDLSESASGDDFRFQGGLLFSRRTSGQTVYGFGAAVTSDFGTPLALPVLQYQHTGDALLVNLLLPKSAQVGFAVGEGWEIGLLADISGTQYHLSEAGPGNQDIDVKYANITLGVPLKRRLTQQLFLLLEGGIALRRRFEFSGNGIDRDLDLERGPYLRAGLAFRPRTPLF